MADPKIAFQLTADDKTDKGAASAEKRMGKAVKRIGDLNSRSARETEKRIGRSGKAMLRTFSDVDKATGKLFGRNSFASGITSRISAIGQAASAMGDGFGEASVAGTALEGTVGALGVAVAGTAAIVAGAAVATFKLADGWSKDAASIGRTAKIFGVGTQALQEFTAAAERAGVDKDTAAGAVGSLSQTLNDAAYGRNPQARAMLSYLGVAMQRKADGTVNVDAMLPKVADAIARQNSSGQRYVAQALGIDLKALPAFMQGGKALSAEMADAGQTAPMITDADAALAQRQQRRNVKLGQLARRELLSNTGRAAASGIDSLENWALGTVGAGGGQGAADQASAAPAAGGTVGGSSVSSGASGARQLNLSAQDIVDLKKVVQTEWDKHSVDQGEGIIDTVLNRLASGHWGSSVADVANARSQFSDINGPVAWRQGRTSVDDIPDHRVSRKTSALVDAWLSRRASGDPSIVGSNLNYANPYKSDRRNLLWIDRLDGGELGTGESVHRHGTTPDLEQYRPGPYNVNLPTVPVHVTVELRGDATKGARTTVTAGEGARISHAFAQDTGG